MVHVRVLIVDQASASTASLRRVSDRRSMRSPMRSERRRVLGLNAVRKPLHVIMFGTWSETELLAAMVRRTPTRDYLPASGGERGEGN